jgi:hypothetical protein
MYNLTPKKLFFLVTILCFWNTSNTTPDNISLFEALEKQVHLMSQLNTKEQARRTLRIALEQSQATISGQEQEINRLEQELEYSETARGTNGEESQASIAEKQTEIEQFQKKIKTKNRIIATTVIGGIIIVAIIGVIYYKNRNSEPTTIVPNEEEEEEQEEVLDEPRVQELIDTSITSAMDNAYNDINTIATLATENSRKPDLPTVETLINTALEGIETETESIAVQKLLSENVNQNVTLDQHVFVHSQKNIHVTNDVVIDGNGATVMFANNVSGDPQFIINENTKATIKNIRLHNLQNTTFQMHENSKLYIGENVIFELGEDVTLNDGAVKVISGPSGISTFIVRGIGGKKIFKLEPSNPRQKDRGTRDEPYNRFLNIGDNNIEFQNIDFNGVSDVTHALGKIQLSGDCSALIDEDTDANFEIKGTSNEFRFIENNLTIKGNVTFGDVSNNTLHINCVIPEYLITAPTINFDENCINLTSNQGKAGIIFDNEIIVVNNKSSDSFVLGAHSFLKGKHVEITGEPIKQTSSDFVLGSDLILECATGNAIEPEFH